MSPRSPRGESGNSRATYAAGLVVAAFAAAILPESFLVLLMILVAGLLVLLLVTPRVAGPVATATEPGWIVDPHQDEC